MPASSARIETASGSRYLQQLCKHWSHKLDVAYTPIAGRIAFPDGRVCTLAADDTGLALRLEANDDEALVRGQSVIVDHLKRFAFRESLDNVGWQRVG